MNDEKIIKILIGAMLFLQTKTRLGDAKKRWSMKNKNITNSRRYTKKVNVWRKNILENIYK